MFKRYFYPTRMYTFKLVIDFSVETTKIYDCVDIIYNVINGNMVVLSTQYRSIV
jgi:hypothetical protein